MYLMVTLSPKTLTVDPLDCKSSLELQLISYYNVYIISLILVIKQDRRAQIGTHRHVSSYAFMVDKEKLKKESTLLSSSKKYFLSFSKSKSKSGL